MNKFEESKVKVESNYKKWKSATGETVDSIIAKGRKWTDSEFPPSVNSIIDREKKILNHENEAFFKSLVWKRAPEMFGNNTCVFNNIEPNDIN